MTAEMHVVAARYVSQAHQLWADAESVYERGESEFAYWMMIDLRRSAYYREIAGSRLAYSRAETFSGLFGTLATRYDGVAVVKELGDGLLIRATSWRPLIEILSIADAVRRSWPAGDERHLAPNFDFSCGLTSGECTRLPRSDQLDYLGSAIDRVARISGFRESATPTLVGVVEAGTAQAMKRELECDYPYLSLQTPHLLPANLQKSEEEPIRISELLIDRGVFDGYQKFFSRLR